MGNGFKSPRATLALTAIAIAWACTTTTAMAAESAAATISSTELSPTSWQYTLALKDDGTTPIGTFWFAWVPGQDFMPTSPSNIVSPSSWAAHVTGGGANNGFAIQWVAGAGAALAPGQTDDFTFDSATSPQQMAGDSPTHPGTPVLTSFVYSGAPFSDAGVQFLVTAAPVPEPSALALMLAGVAFAGVRVARRRTRPAA